MKRRTGRRGVLAAVAGLAAIGMLLSGCGAGGGSNEATGAEEPASGFPNDYQGAYPMPSTDKAYNNPKSRDEVKDGGTLTLPTTYTPIALMPNSTTTIASSAVSARHA